MHTIHLSNKAASLEQSGGRTPVVYFGITVTRLVCLLVLTCGLYRYYWFYKNWKAVKQAEQSNISPFWRSIFAMFFCYSLFKRISESVKASSNKKPFSPSGFAWGYIIFLLLGLWILNIFFLIGLQRAINLHNAQVVSNYEPSKKLTQVEIVLIVMGILLWLAFIVRTLTDPAPNRGTTYHATTKSIIPVPYKQEDV